MGVQQCGTQMSRTDTEEIAAVIGAADKAFGLRSNEQDFREGSGVTVCHGRTLAVESEFDLGVDPGGRTEKLRRDQGISVKET